MKSAQARMQLKLDSLVKEGREGGLQLAVYVQGQLVIDTWAGVADSSKGRLVDGETLFPVFSVTKGIAATIIHILVERGLLNYDTRIAEVWSEFADHDKANITLRHVLGHTAGLPYMPVGLRAPQLCNWSGMCQAIADLTPASPPGHLQVYHAVTYGWLVGEVARRVTGRDFGQLVQEEICQPLNIGSLFVGIPDSVLPLVAVLESDDASTLPLDDPTPREIPPCMIPLHDWMNRQDAQQACIPASNGIMNARGLAKHYAALLEGGVDGIQLLSSDRIAEATQRQLPTNQPSDLPMPSIALGYYFGNDFGHAGFGGSTGFADPRYGLAVGLTKNRFSDRAGHTEILDELRNALQMPI